MVSATDPQGRNLDFLDRILETPKQETLFLLLMRILLIDISGTLSCDHTKVTPYFIESINSRAGFWAVPCPNQFLYYLGFCNPPDDQYVLMGEHISHR
jgi:hypothetical protein